MESLHSFIQAPMHRMFFPVLILVPSVLFSNSEEKFFQSFIKTHCVECHNPEKKKGKFLIHDLGEISSDRTRFAKILEMVRTGDMPPEDEPQPTLEDLDRVAKWIEKTLEPKSLHPQIRSLHLFALMKGITFLTPCSLQ